MPVIYRLRAAEDSDNSHPPMVQLELREDGRMLELALQDPFRKLYFRLPDVQKALRVLELEAEDSDR